MTLGPDDLRAAVAAGLVSEAQAASLLALAAARSGQRAAAGADDEPFEFFRGFAEVFVAVGLAIFLTGVVMLLGWVGLAGPFLAVPAGVAALAWALAEYFALRRRMVLPTTVLAAAFGAGVAALVAGWLGRADFPDPQAMALWGGLAAVAAMAAFYARFRLPVAMLFLGLAVLFVLYVGTADPADVIAIGRGQGVAAFFDLGTQSDFAIATFVFGLGAFAAAMWYDTRDPHRLGRHSATGFWLHLLAAPALVNTVALTLLNLGGAAGVGAVAAAMAAIALVALVIDRRSFLAAGIVYIAVVIGWLIGGDGPAGPGEMIALLLVLGGVVAAFGTWWSDLRGALMRALPGFPGKHRLPPYAP